MEMGKKAKVISDFGHYFKVGEIVTLIKEVTDEYCIDGEIIKVRFFRFMNDDGLEQDLQDDEDFVWLNEDEEEEDKVEEQ
jgi:hypothetical protein